MNARRSIAFSVFINSAIACRALVPAAFPAAAPTSSVDPTLLRFEDQWVVFDYPKGFKVHAAGDPTFRWYPEIDLGGALVVGLGDPTDFSHEKYFRFIRIMRRAMPAGDDLQKIMSETYDRVSQEHPNSESEPGATARVTVSGQAALETTYRVFYSAPAYDVRDIWVLHNGAIYIISISTPFHNPRDSAQFQSLADGIVGSLEFKRP